MKILSKVLREIRSFAIIILIALSLRTTLVEAYIVPTGSMETTIRTGDFLIGNKFAYGMRTPDWIGIPYTDMGFDIPWTRFPSFKTPQRGDVVIFKYPRDVFQKYVKRLIGGPGDTFEMQNDVVFINDKPEGEREFIERKLNRDNHQYYLYYRISLENGEEYLIRQKERALHSFHSFDSLKIPYAGQIIQINDSTKWDRLIPVMLMDGHEVTYENEGLEKITGYQKSKLRNFQFTMDEPTDIKRRYESSLGLKIRQIFSSSANNNNKVQQSNERFRLYTEEVIYGYGSKRYMKVDIKFIPEGDLLNSWHLSKLLQKESSEIDLKYIKVNGRPAFEMDHYIVKQNYYWMMGDNRDDSADSRYWGFVPETHVLGEAVFVYMSWDFVHGSPRFSRVGTVID